MTAEEQALTADEIRRLRNLLNRLDPPWNERDLSRGYRFLPDGAKQYKDYESYVDD